MSVIFLPWKACVVSCVLLILVVSLATSADKVTYAVRSGKPHPCTEQMRKDDKREFDCGDGTCLIDAGHYSRVCDSFTDCFSGADEKAGCHNKHGRNCREDKRFKKMFECGDGMCIPAEYKNDGEFDCLNQADEL